jgi:tetratricopeptide (TPR) repeat protein
MNDEGQVMGLMQRPALQDDTLAYAVSALFADSLQITGLSINSPVLRSTYIKKDLPEQLDQAILTLYIAASTLDTASYTVLINDFIERFPNAPDGYQYRAQQAFNRNDFFAAQSDMEKAISVAGEKDDAHFTYSRLILQKALTKPLVAYEPWTLDLALQEASEAYKLNPLPAYKQQQAMVLFTQKKYDSAYQEYMELSKTQLRSPEIFYEASRCKELLGDTIAQLALLDSAMATFSRPLLKEASPYLLLRAQARMNAKKHREAVFDLNEYESLMRSVLNDRFYYLRYQAEVGGRLYQQALNDIDKAIEMSPATDYYYAEKASLLIRVGLTDQAIECAEKMIKLTPNQSDGYLFLGIAKCQKGDKANGLRHLEKAKQMGDSQADTFIKRYAQ